MPATRLAVLDAEIRFLLRRDDREELKRLAETSDRTLSAEARRALRLYLASMREQAKHATAIAPPGGRHHP